MQIGTFLSISLTLLALLPHDGSCFQCPQINGNAQSAWSGIACFDGQPPQDGSCCTTNDCSFAQTSCECSTRCRGWSADIGYDANFTFPTWSTGQNRDYNHKYDDMYMRTGADDSCRNGNGGLSARANFNSCVILWEGYGCSGNSFQLEGGTIDDIRVEGLSGIQSVSGCNYTIPETVEVKLYQHNFWSWFGYKQTITIEQGNCSTLAGWWNDRASLIRPQKDLCFKVWDNQNCTGYTYCDCRGVDLKMNAVKIPSNPETTFNNRAGSLSLCDYESEEEMM